MTSPQTQPDLRQEQPSEQGGTPRTEEQPESGRTGGKVMHLHTAHPRVPIPYVTPGDMFTAARSGAASKLPAPRKLAYYGLLGGMAVAGVLEWPIAVAVGAATEVITREQAARSRAERAENQRGQPAAEPAGSAGQTAEPAGTPRQATT
jgi:hypothetical protein